MANKSVVVSIGVSKTLHYAGPGDPRGLYFEAAYWQAEPTRTGMTREDALQWVEGDWFQLGYAQAVWEFANSGVDVGEHPYIPTSERIASERRLTAQGSAKSRR